MTVEEHEPVVTRASFLCMQVCVPEDWTDEQVLTFAEGENPCGTRNGWFIRLLAGDPERAPCSYREGFVHIMLDA